MFIENIYQQAIVRFKLKLESFQHNHWMFVGIVKGAFAMPTNIQQCLVFDCDAKLSPESCAELPNVPRNHLTLLSSISA